MIIADHIIKLLVDYTATDSLESSIEALKGCDIANVEYHFTYDSYENCFVYLVINVVTRDTIITLSFDRVPYI
jgi:hypothetical protein